MKNTIITLLSGSVAVAIGIAWNLTIAELSDASDASPTTVFQPELLIQSWGNAIALLAVAIGQYISRNKPKP